MHNPGRFGLLQQDTTDRVACEHENLFLVVLEDGSLRSGYQHGWVPLRLLFWAADCRLLLLADETGVLWGVASQGDLIINSYWEAVVGRHNPGT